MATSLGTSEPPSDAWFLWPIRVHNPNGISIGSAVFSQMTAQCPYILYNGIPFLPLKIAPSHGRISTPSNTWFPGPMRVINPNGISIGAAVFAGLTTMFMVLSPWPRSLWEFTRFIWWMQTERRVAANPQTKPTNLGCESADKWLHATIYIHHRNLLLLLSPKADTHFTVPRRLEGWGFCKVFLTKLCCLYYNYFGCVDALKKYNDDVESTWWLMRSWIVIRFSISIPETETITKSRRLSSASSYHTKEPCHARPVNHLTYVIWPQLTFLYFI